MADNSYGTSPIGAALSQLDGPQAPAQPKTLKDGFEALSQETSIPPNVLMAVDWADGGKGDLTKARSNADFLKSKIAGGASIDQALTDLKGGDADAGGKLLNMSYDIADQLYPDPNAPAKPAPAKDDGSGLIGTAKDTGKALAAGAAQAAGGAGQFLGAMADDALRGLQKENKAAGDTGQTIAKPYETSGARELGRKAGEWGNKTSQDITDTMSPAGKKATEGFQPGGDLMHPSTWTLGPDPSIRGAVQGAAQAGGSLLPVLGASAVGGAPAAAVAGGAMSGGEGAQQGRQYVLEAAKRNGKDGEPIITQIPEWQKLKAEGMTNDQATATLAMRAESDAGLAQSLIGAIGSAGLSKIMGAAEGKIASGGIGARMLKKGLAAGAEEGGTETLEGMGAGAGTKYATGDQTINPTEGSFGNFVLGALSGGPAGAVGGALTPREDQSQLPQEGEQPGDPLLGLPAPDKQLPPPDKQLAKPQLQLPAPDAPNEQGQYAGEGVGRTERPGTHQGFDLQGRPYAPDSNLLPPPEGHVPSAPPEPDQAGQGFHPYANQGRGRVEGNARPNFELQGRPYREGQNQLPAPERPVLGALPAPDGAPQLSGPQAQPQITDQRPQQITDQRAPVAQGTTEGDGSALGAAPTASPESSSLSGNGDAVGATPDDNAGPMQQIARNMAASTPQAPEPQAPPPQRFPDHKPGDRVELANPETNALESAVFMGENETGPLMRINGQQVQLTDQQFDTARNDAEQIAKAQKEASKLRTSKGSQPQADQPQPGPIAQAEQAAEGHPAPLPDQPQAQMQAPQADPQAPQAEPQALQGEPQASQGQLEAAQAQPGEPPAPAPWVAPIRKKAAILRGYPGDTPPEVPGVSFKHDAKAGGWIFSRKHSDKVQQALGADSAMPDAGLPPTPNAQAAQPRSSALPKALKKPLTNYFAKRGIDPNGPAGRELQANGVTPRTAPRLFKNGGLQSLDNLPANEHPELNGMFDSSTGDGYLDPNALEQGLIRESHGEAQMIGDQGVAHDIARSRVEADRAAQMGEPSPVPDMSMNGPSKSSIPSRNEDISTDSERFHAVTSMVRATADHHGVSLSPDEQSSLIGQLERDGGSVEDALYETLMRSVRDGDEQPAADQPRDVAEPPFGDGAPLGRSVDARAPETQAGTGAETGQERARARDGDARQQTQQGLSPSDTALSEADQKIVRAAQAEGETVAPEELRAIRKGANLRQSPEDATRSYLEHRKLESDGPAKRADLDVTRGEEAYRNTSFNAERHAESDVRSYVEAVNGLKQGMEPLAKTDAQKAVLDAEVERYRQGYIKHQNAMWSARSRVASPMITGPAKFPTARNQKALDREHKRTTEFLDWDKKARASIRRALSDARPDEAEANDEWKQLERQLMESVASLKAIDTGEYRGGNRALFAQNLKGRVERLAKNGQTDLVDKALTFLREAPAKFDMPKPIFTDRASIWKLGDEAKARASKQEAAAAEGPREVGTFDGAEVWADPRIDRVQITMDQRPDKTVTGDLKKEGWKWSRANGAWQRKMTNAAIASARRIMGKHYPEAETQAAPAEAAPAEAVQATPEAPTHQEFTQAAKDADPNPSEGQKEAGNYKLGHIGWNGLDLSIENAKGSKRRGVDGNGEKWETTMPAAYGYIKGSEGADGDHVDFYMGDAPASDYVMIVDQADPKTGKFDEHKLVLGTTARGAALDIYRGGFSDGSGDSRIGGFTETTVNGLKSWIDSGKTKGPVKAMDFPFKAPAKPETNYEPGAEGKPQAIMPGMEGSKAQAETSAQQRARMEMEARQQQSKMRKVGGNTGSAGPLFDDQGDMFAQPAPQAEAKPQAEASAPAQLETHQTGPETGQMTPERAREEAIKWSQREGANAGGFYRAPDGMVVHTSNGQWWGRNRVKKADDKFFVWDDHSLDAYYFKTKDLEAAAKDQAENPQADTATGASDAELTKIVSEFADAQRQTDQADADGWQISHLFDEPKKSEIVRLNQKSRVYHDKHGWMSPEEAKAKIAEWRKHAEAQGGPGSKNADKVVLSLFDLSGKWSEPWEKAGYQVYRFDIQADPEMGDVNNFSTEFFNDWFGSFDGQDIYAVLAACPCTDFASSGARHFAAKDADGRTVDSVKLVHQTLNTIEYFKPQVWAVENPVGRIEKLGGLPPWRLSFDPNDTGEPYTKKTLLWGRFNGEMPVAPVEPTEGSKMWAKYGGKSQATKNARSVTPEGFAYSFFMANNAIDNPKMALANKYDRLPDDLIGKAVDAGLSAQDVSNAVDDPYYIELNDDMAKSALEDAIKARASGQSGAPSKGMNTSHGQWAAGVMDAAEARLNEGRDVTFQIGQGRALKLRHAMELKDNMRATEHGLEVRQGKRWLGLGVAESDALAQQLGRKGWVDQQADTPDQPAPLARNEMINDFGEKIGGARKDMGLAPKRGTGEARAKSDETSWRKAFKVTKTREGKFVITTSKGKRVGGWGGPSFDTEAEAEKMLPTIAIAHKHRVYSDGKGFAIYRTFASGKRTRIKTGFDTRDQAMRYMVAHPDEIAGIDPRLDDRIHPQLKEAIRKGAERRKGDANVGAKDFADTFGFRGVEFGNWNNSDERQHVINQAYDAFLDLAEILKVPPKALSLNGDLAIGFGSRGSGLTGARAHYEPQRAVINMTKIKGAGALAHEWWHAFDHYLSRQDGNATSARVDLGDGSKGFEISSSDRSKIYASHGMLYRSGLRDAVKEAVKKVVGAIDRREAEYVDDASRAEKVALHSINTLDRKLESFRNGLAIEQRYGAKKAAASPEQLAQIDKAIADIKARKLGDKTTLTTKSRLPYEFNFDAPVVELQKLYKELRGRQGYGTNQNRKTGEIHEIQTAIDNAVRGEKLIEDAKQERVKTKRVLTEFRSRARELDEGRASPYWDTAHELTARAFESWVYDHLGRAKGRNDYLAFEKHNDLPEYKLLNVKPYPEGAERETINKAFDDLFQTLETRTTEVERADGTKTEGAQLYQRDGMDRAPVAELKGNELGAWADIRQLGRKAFAWYRKNLIGKSVTNGETGWQIEFNNTGAKKIAGRKGQDILKAIPALESILRDGHVVDSQPDRKGRSDIVAIHKIAAPVTIDGQTQNFIATVRETSRGTFHYDLSADNRGGQTEGSAAHHPAGRQDRKPALEGSPAGLNLSVSSENINPGSKDMAGLTADLNAMNAAAGTSKKVNVRVVRSLLDGAGIPVRGRYQGGTIEVSASSPDAAHTMRHELIHALRDETLWGEPYGMFSRDEWRALVDYTRKDKELSARVADVYSDLSAAARTEEMVAEHYANWASDRAANPPGAVRQAFERVRSFLRSLASALGGKGFVDAEAIMRRIADGQPDGSGPSGPGRGPSSYQRQRVDLGDAVIGGDLSTLSTMASHDQAKAGDRIAAMMAAKTVVTPELVAKVKAMIGDRKPTIVPVASIEQSGRNKIPLAGAERLGSELGLGVDHGIVQTNRPQRTEKSGLDRIFASPEFDGPVEPGREYLLLDDTITQGATFAALASHIEAQGGKVVGSVALTGKEYSATLTPDQSAIDRLREKYGDLEQDFRAATGHGFDALTASEVRYLTKFKPAERVRNRILAERDAARRALDARAAGPREDGGKYQRPLDQVSQAFLRNSSALKNGMLGRGNWQKPGEFMSHMLTDAMGRNSKINILGLVPGEPLFRELGKHLPSAQKYAQLKQQMDSDRNNWQAKTSETVDAWVSLARKDANANQDLMQLMHETTIAGVDPSTPDSWRRAVDDEAESVLASTRSKPERKEWAREILKQRDQREELWKDAKARYDKLPAAFRRMYGQVRDTYAELADNIDEAVINNVKIAAQVAYDRAKREHAKELERIRDEGMTGTERATARSMADIALDKARKRFEMGTREHTTSLREKFEMNRLAGPYFPLARFGNYFVTVRDDKGKVISFSRFETQAKQEAYVAQAEKEHPGRVQRGVLSDTAELQAQIDPAFVSDIIEMLGDNDVNRELLDSIWQSYLETMPDFSIRNAKIHRKNRMGYNSDAVRAFSSAMFHGAHQLARLKYGLEMGNELDKAQLEASEGFKPERAGFVVNEMRKRHDFTMRPTNNPLITAANSVAFFWYLGMSPAAALVNLSQTTILGLPILGSHYSKLGVSGAAKELTRATKDFANGKGKVTKRVAGVPVKMEMWGTENSLTGDDLRAMEEGYRRGTIDRTQAHDLASVAESGVQYNPTREKVMRVIGFMFHHTERMNREVTYLAAYRMARKTGMGHDAAMNDADAIVKRVHFDYQNNARPRVMQSDLGKIMTVFRNYTVNMLYRMFRDAHQTFAGDTPEARREARSQLIGITLSLMGHAGIRGVWGYSLLMGLLGMFFPGGGDDMDAWLQDALLMHGDDPGTAAWNWTMGMVLNGVPGQITGTNLTNRIGMPDLWFRSPYAGLEGKDVWLNYLEQIAGPVVGALPGSFMRAAQLAQEGKIERGAETASPVWAKNIMKGVRYSTEGVTTLNGDPLIEDVSAYQAIVQALGFTPAQVSERYDINSRLKNQEREITSMRSDAMKAAAEELRAGQPISEKTIERIKDFNRQYPFYPISADNIRQSARARNRAHQRNEFGVGLNPKLNDYLRSNQPPSVWN
ncbi:PLxRFG domain-containing protein [Thioclava sp. DLFJ5-1]|uniref:PLxRFG domain-containing protein n=1 Tax=Thioclava sp. DLFJ5-1 TaxID=1915314 RepID=UPI0009984871|nr:PLxRFG domain-containing protein [Thioclava sp. DLFJ5-1]